MRALGPALLGAAMLVGCQARVAERPRQPELGRQGSSWEAVFLSPGMSRALATSDPRTLPEYSRNDAALNPRPIEAQLATRQWPEPARPSLSRPRRVYLETSPNQLLFFERGESGSIERPSWNWYWP